MNLRRIALALVTLVSTALAACDPGAAPTVGTARLSLTAEMVAAADVMTLVAWRGDEAIPVWSFDDADPGAAAPDEAVFELEPGDYDRLELLGDVAGRRLYVGETAAFTVEAGAEVVVRLVIDPYGRLEVIPTGLDALAEVEVIAALREPWPGQDDRYPLTLGEGFVGDIPVGTYDIEIALPGVLGAFETLDLLEARVVAGGVITLRPAFGVPDSPDPPPPPLVVAEVLELVLAGGAQLGAGVDISVRALDGDGRIVPDYAGEVRFTYEVLNAGALNLGELSIELPAAFGFTPEDRGSHVFAAGLLVDLVGRLISVELAVTVTDDAGLEARGEICIEGLLGGC